MRSISTTCFSIEPVSHQPFFWFLNILDQHHETTAATNHQSQTSESQTPVLSKLPSTPLVTEFAASTCSETKKHAVWISASSDMATSRVNLLCLPACTASKPLCSDFRGANHRAISMIGLKPASKLNMRSWLVKHAHEMTNKTPIVVITMMHHHRQFASPRSACSPQKKHVCLASGLISSQSSFEMPRRSDVAPRLTRH